MNKVNLYIFKLTNKYILLNIIFISILILFINTLEITRIIDQQNSNIYHFMYLIVTSYSNVISCHKRLFKKNHKVVFPSQLDDNWFIDAQCHGFHYSAIL